MQPDIKRQIDRLFEAFPQTAKNETMIDVLFTACEAVPFEVVERAVNDFVFGRVLGHNMAFMPSTAAFNDRLERSYNRIRVEQYNERKAREQAEIFKPHEPKTEAQKERVRELTRRFKEATQRYSDGNCPPANFRSAARRQAFEGREILAENVKLKQFEIMGKTGSIPPGSTWSWETGCIYGPKHQPTEGQENEGSLQASTGNGSRAA